MNGIGIGQGRHFHQLRITVTVDVHENLCRGHIFDRAVGQREVGLVRQRHRILEESLFTNPDTALDGHRTADRVNSLLEGREDQSVAAVDDLVVQGDNRHRLGRCPGFIVKDHERPDRRGDGAVRGDREVAIEIRTVFHADRKDPTEDIDIVIGGHIVESVQSECPGNGGQIVAELDVIRERFAAKRERPLFRIRRIEGRLAGEFDIDGTQTNRRRGIARTADRQRAREHAIMHDLQQHASRVGTDHTGRVSRRSIHTSYEPARHCHKVILALDGVLERRRGARSIVGQRQFPLLVGLELSSGQIERLADRGATLCVFGDRELSKEEVAAIGGIDGKYAFSRGMREVDGEALPLDSQFKLLTDLLDGTSRTCEGLRGAKRSVSARGRQRNGPLFAAARLT